LLLLFSKKVSKSFKYKENRKEYNITLSANIPTCKKSENSLLCMLGYYVKLFVIMYADDTVPLAKFASNLQNMLNLFQEYCMHQMEN
jgi:hypothetical protein